MDFQTQSYPIKKTPEKKVGSTFKSPQRTEKSNEASLQTTAEKEKLSKLRNDLLEKKKLLDQLAQLESQKKKIDSVKKRSGSKKVDKSVATQSPYKKKSASPDTIHRLKESTEILRRNLQQIHSSQEKQKYSVNEGYGDEEVEASSNPNNVYKMKLRYLEKLRKAQKSARK